MVLHSQLLIFMLYLLMVLTDMVLTDFEHYVHCKELMLFVFK